MVFPDSMMRLGRRGPVLAVLAAWLVPAGLPAAGPEPVPGRIVVRLTEEGARALRAGALDLPVPPGGEASAPVVSPLFRTRHGDLGRFAVLTFAPGPEPRPAANAPWLAALASDPRVAGASPDAALPLSALPDDPYLLGDGGLPNQFPLLNPGGLSLNATRAWPFVPYGRAVPVAIVDSGVDWRHPDLGGPQPPGGAVWINPAERDGTALVDDDANGFVDDVVGWDFVHTAGITGANPSPNEDGVDPDNDPSDFAGHGTQVAGLVTALTDNGIGIAGTARDAARILPVRAGWQHATQGAKVYMTFCAQAIEYAALVGARVINGSWDSIKCGTGCPADEFGLEAALNFAVQERDVVVTASAGNGNTQSTNIQYMASRPDVLGVAGVKASGVKASASNYGPWVDLAAFYDDMPSTAYNRNSPTEKSTYVKVLGGTSFAAPQVAGAAAVCRAVAPDADAAAIRGVLAGSARDLRDLDAVYGHLLGGGLLDMAAAVESLTGGWSRDGNGAPITPWEPGCVALAGDAGLSVCVVDVARPPQSACGPGDALGALPAMARFASGTVFVTVAGDQARAVTGDGSAAPGWPVTLPGAATQVVAADLDGGGDEALVVAGDDLVVLAGDGASTVVPGWHEAWITVGDFHPERNGLEIVGVSELGRVTALDAGLQPIAGWSRMLEGTYRIGHPAAAELDGPGQGAVLALMGELPKDGIGLVTRVHVFREGQHRQATLEGEWTAITPLGFAQGTRLRVAVAGPERIAVFDADLLAAPDVLEVGGALAGDLLCADVDGDADADLVALREDGVLLAWHQDLTPVSGFPRVFPGGFGPGPVVVDGMTPVSAAAGAAPGGTRRILLSGSDLLWSLPVGGHGESAPWPCPGGDPGRTRFLDFARATPVDLAARLAWSWEGTGRACWTLEGDAIAVSALRLVLGDASGPVVWTGDAGASCAAVSGVHEGSRLHLEARDRAGAWTRLASLAVPGRSALVLLPAYPNPFRASVGFAYRLDGDAPARLVVVDASGRLVHEAALPAPAGNHVWDGRDASGRAVAAGTYFARLAQGAQERRVRVLRVP